MPRNSHPPTQSESSDLETLSPSAKLVAKTLEYEGDSTQSSLADSTLLPARTVRYALTQLAENDIVTSRVSLVDARQRVYSLDERRGEPDHDADGLQ